jgi:hypothetical protein
MVMGVHFGRMTTFWGEFDSSDGYTILRISFLKIVEFVFKRAKFMAYELYHSKINKNTQLLQH